MSSHQYPEDEFDQAGKDRPVGVHRQKPSQWKTVLPFLLVLIIVPILAWGAVSLITGKSSSPESEQKPEATTAQVEETTQPPTEQTEATQTEATEKPTEATEKESEDAGKDADASIAVLNGTGVNGLAASVTGKLQENGYNNVAADNAQGWLTDVSTIYYAPGHLEGAQRIGTVLGIDMMVENAQVLGNYNYVVVLRGDYNG